MRDRPPRDAEIGVQRCCGEFSVTENRSPMSPIEGIGTGLGDVPSATVCSASASGGSRDVQSDGCVGARPSEPDPLCGFDLVEWANEAAVALRRVFCADGVFVGAPVRGGRAPHRDRVPERTSTLGAGLDVDMRNAGTGGDGTPSSDCPASPAGASSARRLGHPPFGYRWAVCAAGQVVRVLGLGEQPGRDEAVQLVGGPDDEQRLVRTLLNAAARRRRPWTELVALARDRCPAVPWTKKRMETLLRNRVYVGAAVTRWGAVAPPHMVAPLTDTSIRGVGHPPLVSPEVFAAAQYHLEHWPHGVRMLAGTYPVLGLVTCAACGSPYIGTGYVPGWPSRPHTPGSEARSPGEPHYGDAGYFRAVHPCPGPGLVRQSRFERAFVHAVAPLADAPAAQAALRRALEASGLFRTPFLDPVGQVAPVGDPPSAPVAEPVAEPAADGVKAPFHATLPAPPSLGSSGAVVDAGTAPQLLDVLGQFAHWAPLLDGPGLRAVLEPWVLGGTYDKERRTLTLRLRAPATLTGGAADHVGVRVAPSGLFEASPVDPPHLDVPRGAPGAVLGDVGNPSFGGVPDSAGDPTPPPTCDDVQTVVVALPPARPPRGTGYRARVAEEYRARGEPVPRTYQRAAERRRLHAAADMDNARPDSAPAPAEANHEHTSPGNPERGDVPTDVSDVSPEN